MSLKSLFHTISFTPVDPLADGLAEEIAAEQAEPEAIKTLDDISEDELNAYWSNVSSAMHADAHSNVDWSPLEQQELR